MIRATTMEETRKYAGLICYQPTADAKGVISELGSVVLYDHWTPNSVNVHIYSSEVRSLFEPEFVHAIFDYAFNQAGKGLLIAITPADNESSLGYSKWLGFKEGYRIKDGWSAGVDLILKEMRREDCRWLRKAA